jgi:hypothetical protein
LTLLDAVDWMLGDKTLKGKFRDGYDWFSEFCHPNLFSRMAAGYDLDVAKHEVRFHLRARTRKPDLEQIVNYAIISQLAFFHAYSRIASAVGGIPSYDDEARS